MTRLLILIICLMTSAPAWAQTSVLIPNPASRGVLATGATVGTTHGTVVAAGYYGLVEIDNESQTAGGILYCVWGGTAVAAATAGQTTIYPGGSFIWDAGNPAPSGVVLDCVAALASTPVTVRAW